jgi:hypothetical protein
MAVAAQSCLALQAEIRARGTGLGSGRRLQHAVARTVRGPWNSATSIDVFYPHPDGTRPTAAHRFGLTYVNRVIRAAIDRPDIAGAFESCAAVRS